MECHRCDGSGVVMVSGCTADCTLLRHAPACPTDRPIECPACAKERMGDDLPTGSA